MHFIIEFEEGDPVSLYKSQMEIGGDFLEVLQTLKEKNESITFEDKDGVYFERSLGDMVSFKIIF